jgi:hypothetical protein
MRFLSIWHPSPAAAASDCGPSPEKFAEMGKFVEDSIRRGVLIATGGRQPTSDHTRVVSDGGEIRVVDGPYAEAKELVGGFALLELPSHAAAIEETRRFLRLAGDGVCEVYALADGT